MADINQLPTNSATFDDIKQDLIDFMSNQTEFKDYDFAGSRLSVIMDLLTYNTAYLQQYSNAAMFESFMRTALKRSSVVQHAQDMGYSVTSTQGSATQVRLTGIHQLNPSSVVLPVGTRFVGSVQDVNTYDFVNWDTVQMLRNPDNTYQARIDLIQGVIGRFESKYKEGETLIVRDKDLDRNYIRVFVDEEEWTNWTDKSIVNITGGSTVYYVRETVDGSTEVYFGEGQNTEYTENDGAYTPKYIGGLRPITGQTIRIEFLKTSGSEANGSQKFAFADSISNFQVTEVKENPDDDADYTGSAGGGEPESKERIKELAPIFRESQRRCVTKLDYETFVSQRFANYVQAIQAYSEKGKPGYAFIAIKPFDGLSLTTVQKEDIEAYLAEFNILTVTAKVVDPDYLYVNHRIKVNYNPAKLNEGIDSLKTDIVNSISTYYNNEVEIFNSSFHVSKMLSNVDTAHPSILGSRCDIDIVKELTNFYLTPMAGVSFQNPIFPRFSSTDFKFVPGNYNVSYKSTDSSKIVVGPYKSGDITVKPPYTGNDFDRTTIGSQTLWYEVGTVDYVTGRMDFDLGELGRPATDYDAARVVYYASPERTNIYVNSGSLCVYEYDLRPEYTTIELEAITNG